LNYLLSTDPVFKHIWKNLIIIYESEMKLHELSITIGIVDISGPSKLMNWITIIELERRA